MPYEILGISNSTFFFLSNIINLSICDNLSQWGGVPWGWQALLLPLVVRGLVWVANVPDCKGSEALACEVDAVTFFRNIN